MRWAAGAYNVDLSRLLEDGLLLRYETSEYVEVFSPMACGQGGLRTRALALYWASFFLSHYVRLAETIPKPIGGLRRRGARVQQKSRTSTADILFDIW